MNSKLRLKIEQLGGHIGSPIGLTLFHQLKAIKFDSVLYPKPIDTPWSSAEDTEPIYGLAAYVDRHKRLLENDPERFYQKLLSHFFRRTNEPRAQTIFGCRLFTPYKKGTKHFREWNLEFIDPDSVDLQCIKDIVKLTTPDLIQIASSYSFPSQYYVCLNDPEPSNPAVFSTDHTTFFQEVNHEGSLLDFFNTFLTKQELLKIVKHRLNSR
jgi:hypothetical protein